MSVEITAAQVVLEGVLESAAEGLVDARKRHDEASAAAFYHVLSIAVANAKALDVVFANDELNSLDPDALLRISAT